MKRRSIAKYAAVAAVLSLGLTACGGASGSADAKTSGTVRVTLANHVWTEGIKAAIPEFEKSSGLKVELTQLGEDQLSDQYNVKLNAGSDEIDVMMYRPLQEGKAFAKNGYLADLTSKVSSDAEWDWKDYQEGPVKATTADGKVVGVPIITEREVLYYRKDLLKAAGLEVPKTMDELEAAAKAIKAASPGTAGFVARTGKSAAVTQFSSFLYSFGGDFTDASGKSAVNSDAAKKAYAFYGGLIKNYGPGQRQHRHELARGNGDLHPGQGRLLHGGRLALQERHRPGQVQGRRHRRLRRTARRPAPVRSRTTSRPGASPSTRHPATRTTPGSSSSGPPARNAPCEAQKAGVPGPRASVWADPAGTSTYPKDLAEAIAASAKNGVGHDRPEVVTVGKAREIVGGPIVATITGADSSAAADTAHDAFQKFLDSEKK